MTELLTLDTVEVHAEGEPGRVVLNAAELVPDETMADRFAYCRDNLDDLRRMLLREPRVHGDALQAAVELVEGVLPAEEGPCVLFVDALDQPLEPVLAPPARRRRR